ncbi:hypothetical protein BZA77DRAFT_384202 [Pyronema omphalodes]|nr:hypothetical protein BZA77DRAFT_384202 [Pyronema omphalodes]
MSSSITASPDLTELFSLLNSDRLTLQKLAATVPAVPPVGAEDVTANSDLSITDADPVALDYELVHYRNLFQRLKFSYLEQIAKEKFVRTITDDNRVFPEAEENDALVEKVMAAKNEWKQSKRELEAMVDRVKGLGERIAPAYEDLMKELKRAETRKAETAEMRNIISTYESTSDNRPGMNLPLAETLKHIEVAELTVKALESELESIQAALPEKKRRLDELAKAIDLYEKNKEDLERLVEEEMKEREGERAAGRVKEDAGQWYKRSCEVYTVLLE